MIFDFIQRFFELNPALAILAPPLNLGFMAHSMGGIGSSGEGATGVERSLRLRRSASAYLSQAFSTPTDNKKFSFCVGIQFGNNYDGSYPRILSAGNDYLRIDDTGGVPTLYWSIAGAACQSSRVLRDYAGIGFLTFAVDTTQATPADRVKAWWNDEQITSFSSSAYPALNATPEINSAVTHYIGWGAASQYFDGLICEPRFVDGSAPDYTAFLELNSNNILVPKTFTGSWGNNGTYPNFRDGTNTTTLGYDVSGNANHWTCNNVSLTADVTYDLMYSYPVNGASGSSAVIGAYATWNPLDNGGMVLASANLNITASASSRTCRATLGMTTGVHWWEETLVQAQPIIGIATVQATTAGYLGSDAYGWGYYPLGGSKWTNGGSTAYGSTAAAGDVIGIKFDADNGTLEYFKQTGGTGSFVSMGVAFSGLTTGITYFPASGNNAGQTHTNFGQRPWNNSSLPASAKGLCTANMAAPSILDPSEYFDVATWAGNGTTQNITGYAFQPDAVWTKCRNNGYSWGQFDAVRGATNSVSSNTTNAESTDANSLTSFNSDGFSVGSSNWVNYSLGTFVAPMWKAGGAPTTDNVAGAGNVPTAGSVKINGANYGSALAGTIAATRLSANTTAGFSIVTYAGTGANATVGHGLGVAPKMVIVKARQPANGSNRGWYVYHSALANTEVLQLDSTAAKVTGATTYWNSTSPTSSVFSLGTENNVNNATGGATPYVALCFAEIEGYSKAFSAYGNGSADGVFIPLPFLMRWGIFKMTGATGAGNWYVFDIDRETGNVMINPLWPNLSNAETPNAIYSIDIVCNGIKIRTTAGSLNQNGELLVGFAIAKHPLALNPRAR